MRSLALALVVWSAPALATPTTVTDTTPFTAIVDGMVTPGEYVGSSAGINAGFGGALGQSPMHVDSDAFTMSIGLEALVPLNDFVTIYFDTEAGGFPDTLAFVDGSDVHRAAASGVNFPFAVPAPLLFGPDFAPEYALAFDNNVAVLFRLEAGAPHTFVSLPLFAAGPAAYEVQIPLAELGISAQGSDVHWLATLGNPADPASYFRSDEFHGVSPLSVPPGNPGPAPVVLAPGDFNTLTTWCEDDDLDGICSDVDLCVGDDALGDANGDGFCDLGLEVSSVVPGQPMTFEAIGAPPAQRVYFFVSPRGPGAGPCAPGTTTCLDITRPIQVGSARATLDGDASLTLTVPNSLSAGTDLWFQAVWGDGFTANTSNVATATVAP